MWNDKYLWEHKLYNFTKKWSHHLHKIHNEYIINGIKSKLNKTISMW